jgi:arabinan endo-1,5-alpha-L-arabinosidase
VSTDLVNWTYVGDALPPGAAGLPPYAAPTAALWAPEVVYSPTFRRYYLFVVVTDTTPAGGGSATAEDDSAIGVATSSGPTGPWTFSPTPVVAPRPAPGGGYYWTYDPDVLGDAVGATSTLYYGSYFGGIFGTSVRLTATGAVADSAGARMVAIGNRYEGANVVERGGWYYLFASATNCCNGALTGYAVFVGRSRSPLGPFVDREGNPLTASRVGGTPFLVQNGNRWVGTGHNTVFRDRGDQWWTIYHAVDQRDPFFATEPGFTKRPALLDAVDWVSGWPTVNGGRGPSDTGQPAPAGQPGEQSRHRLRPAREQVPGRLLGAHSDEFSGTTLSSAWSWLRPAKAPAGPPAVTVGGGVLTAPLQAADLFVDSNSAWVPTRDAPDGDYVVETKVKVDVPDEGCCFNYAQAGLLVVRDADNYVKLTNTSIWETRQTEFGKELSPVPTGWHRYGNTVVGPPGAPWTWLRIAVHRLRGAERAAAGGDTESYTAYTSQDGRRWVKGGTWTHRLGDARIGLAFYGASGFTAQFDHVRTWTLREQPARR